MEITSNSIEICRGPSEWFSGSVFIDPIAAVSAASSLSASAVGSPFSWGEHVTDEEYGKAPEVTTGSG